MMDDQDMDDREEERRAWARFVAASIDMAAAQMVAAVGLVQETLGVYHRAEVELEAATEALKLCGVDATKYLEVACEEYGKAPLPMPEGRP